MNMNRGAAAEEVNALLAYNFQSMKICDGMWYMIEAESATSELT
jgi:hypothetical protein